MDVHSILVKTISPGVLHSIIAFVVIFIISFAIYLFFKRKIETQKQKIKFRSRLTYVAICVFAIALIQIWIEGLTHVFTMLGLVGAGLVVSNKESIMNFIGFLIINWRGVFTEGDFIQIQSYTGYVESIHPLYFKVFETTGLEQQKATGKTIKIPNNLIITTPAITFTPETNVALRQLKFTIDWNCDSRLALQICEKTIKALVQEQYEGSKNYVMSYFTRRNKHLANLINLEPKVYAKMPVDKSKGLMICIDYYSYALDNNAMETKLWQTLQTELQQANIHLIF